VIEIPLAFGERVSVPGRLRLRTQTDLIRFALQRGIISIDE
jgi:hypothetical protein